jgi:hypothetical protein
MNVSEKLSKVSDNYTVNMYDNGFMIEISGRNNDNDWATAKILCSDLETVIQIVQEIATMARDN